MCVKGHTASKACVLSRDWHSVMCTQLFTDCVYVTPYSPPLLLSTLLLGWALGRKGNSSNTEIILPMVSLLGSKIPVDILQLHVEKNCSRPCIWKWSQMPHGAVSKVWSVTSEGGPLVVAPWLQDVTAWAGTVWGPAHYITPQECYPLTSLGAGPQEHSPIPIPLSLTPYQTSPNTSQACHAKPSLH